MTSYVIKAPSSVPGTQEDTLSPFLLPPKKLLQRLWLNGMTSIHSVTTRPGLKDHPAESQMSNEVKPEDGPEGRQAGASGGEKLFFG